MYCAIERHHIHFDHQLRYILQQTQGKRPGKARHSGATSDDVLVTNEFLEFRRGFLRGTLVFFGKHVFKTTEYIEIDVAKRFNKKPP